MQPIAISGQEKRQTNHEAGRFALFKDIHMDGVVEAKPLSQLMQKKTGFCKKQFQFYLLGSEFL